MSASSITASRATVRLVWRHMATARVSSSGSGGRAPLHTTAGRRAVTKFTMPAMSPTMTEGGLATWKVKEGDTFNAGDVLLEIETDKATMDVEAQEDGIMAKIVVEAGAKGVPVGKTIAMLAEEGDDISNVEVPADEAAEAAPPPAKKEQKPSLSSAAPTPPKSDKAEPSTASASAGHAPDIGRALFPSVSRILAENHVSVEDAKRIKGTGMHGMITKGDALVFLGKASSPTGSYTEPKSGIAVLGGPPSGSGGAAPPKKASSAPLTDDGVRALIFAGLAASSHASRSKVQAAASAQRQSTASVVSDSATTRSTTRRSAFDELLDEYDFGGPSAKAKPSTAKKDSFAGSL